MRHWGQTCSMYPFITFTVNELHVAEVHKSALCEWDTSTTSIQRDENKFWWQFSLNLVIWNIGTAFSGTGCDCHGNCVSFSWMLINLCYTLRTMWTVWTKLLKIWIKSVLLIAFLSWKTSMMPWELSYVHVTSTFAFTQELSCSLFNWSTGSEIRVNKETMILKPFKNTAVFSVMNSGQFVL